MKSLFLTLLAALLILFSVRTTFAQEDELLILKDDETSTHPESEETTEESTDTDLTNQVYMDFYDAWRQFELQLKLGSVDEKLIGDLIRLRNKNGIPKMTEFALSAIRFGQSKMSEGKPEDALALFRVAANLDPTLSIAYYSQAKALMHSSWFNLPRAISVAISGLFAPAGSFNGKIYIYSKYALILTATLLISGAAFALIMLAKYYRLLRHDFMERLTSLSGTVIVLVVWVFLFLPLLALAGFLWLAPFWLMIFWKYMRFSEKILSIVFFGVFLFAYPVYQYVVRVSAASVDESVAPFIRVFSDGPSPRIIADFHAYAVDHSGDADSSIMLAHLYRAGHNYVDAIKVLQKHILDHPQDARAYNNLAHIYFLQGETDIALRMAQRAQDLDPHNAIYPYNVSILQRAKFNFNDAEDSLARSRRLDRQLIKQFEESPYSGLIDAIPNEDDMIKKIRQKTGTLADFLVNPFSLFTAVLLGLTLVQTGGNPKKKFHAKECIKCGRPFCKKCQPAVKEFRFCTQCLHIFVKKDGVSPASRKDKMREIEDYSHRRHVFLTISSLILPGFANLYKNRTWFGTILLVFWFLFLVLIFYNWRFGHFSFYESSGSTGVLLPIFLLFLALLYLVANISLLPKTRA
jgi:tetratricopeptide (TPR) repeat protein